MRWLLLVALLAETAAADPCRGMHGDPIATPLRDASLDAQRGACLRGELAATLTAQALIDTPAFRGLLGGDVALSYRAKVGARLELGARAHLVDYTFAQNAVTKVNDLAFGPLVTTAVLRFDQLALVAALEVPYTRDDRETVRTGGQLALVTTNMLASRWLVHGRLGTVAAYATSSGGSTRHLVLQAGADLVRRGNRIALHAGAELQAGWYVGLDTVLVRAGLTWAPGGGAWLVRIGAGVPLGGDDRTNAVVTLGVAREIGGT